MCETFCVLVTKDNSCKNIYQSDDIDLTNSFMKGYARGLIAIGHDVERDSKCLGYIDKTDDAFINIRGLMYNVILTSVEDNIEHVVATFKKETDAKTAAIGVTHAKHCDFKEDGLMCWKSDFLTVKVKSNFELDKKCDVK